MTHRILGYADRLSARPGESLAFKVSSEMPGRYRWRICRMISGDDSPDGPGVKTVPLPGAESGGMRRARFQKIAYGSYIRIPAAPAFRRDDFALQVMIYPTLPGKGEAQAILGNFDAADETGYALFLDGAGRAAFRLGANPPLVLPEPLLARHWYHLRVEVSAAGEVRLASERQRVYARREGRTRAQAQFASPAGKGGDFLIGAWNRGAETTAHFNGKIDAPRLAGRTDVPDSRSADPKLAGNIAAWDFSRQIMGDRILDLGAGRHHGRAVNKPTRAVTGWSWDGSVFDWRQKPAHYGAIHFHDDDLSDCRWATDFRFRLPKDLQSGIYAAHLTQEDEAGAIEEDYIPFFVVAPKGKASAPLAVLIPTASYLAYANHQMPSSWWFDELSTGKFTTFNPVDRYLEEHAGFGLSVYDIHNDGSGVCYSSAKRPILNMRPKTELWQFNADLHIVDWLEARGIAYDIVTDLELHREGRAALEPYRAVMTGTHPEYYSLAMLRGLIDYTDEGGRLIYLGANGFYWRIAYDGRGEIIEHRRAEDGMRGWIAEGGEYHMSLTGELGGLWRRMGYPPQAVCGVGFTAQGFIRSSFYRREKASFDPRAAFIFAGIDPQEKIGDFGLLGNGAAGWEIDRADSALGTPPHALIVAAATDFPDHYHWVKEEMTHTHSAVNGETCPLVRCDMVFYETPKGGAVFSTGSISWAASLSHRGYDNNVSRLTENVVRRFVDPAPFP